METTDAALDDHDHGDAYCATCPCRDTLDLVGSKWTVLVIGRLQEHPHRFGELRRAVPGITQKMLTQTLRRLERDGLVHRHVLVEHRPPSVEYSLTELGETISAPLEAIRIWSEDHLPHVRAARADFDERADTTSS